MNRIEKQKEEARNINGLVNYLIDLIESNDERYSFEFAVGGTMEIYDKKSGMEEMLCMVRIQ